MAFVDALMLTLAAGDGGDGVVRWRREKFVAKGGPAGGDGGKGGDVYLEAVSDLTILGRYRGKRGFHAEAGEAGGSSQKHGKDGDDFVLQVPVGTFATDEAHGRTYDLTVPGQRVQVLRGGGGGRGNYVFRSSTNTTPTTATGGGKGEQAPFLFELRLVVDIGLIGLPNAGKSSLLNELTAARARIGAYPFTTLEPNLGMFDTLVLADIPGLIEGAASGKGLGIKFLRHIERTKLLGHCISLEHQNVQRAYDAVRTELVAYGRGLDAKPEVIILTKSDLVKPDVTQAVMQQLRAQGHRVVVCSIHDAESLERLGATLHEVRQ